MKTVTVNNDNKDELYQTTVLLFQNIGQMCSVNIGGWKLVESFTSVDQEIFETKYSNGKMWIKAYSICGNHKYSYGAES